MRAACAGTTKKGARCTMPAAKGDYCYLHDPDPAVAKRRSRNASRAATLGNSKVGAEIRNTRLMVRELLEVTLSGDLDPAIRKRLAEVVQLLQVYARLAELEIAAGERPKTGDVALPEDMGERVKGWTEDEAEREKQKGKELAEALSEVMKTQGHDPAPIREVRSL